MEQVVTGHRSRDFLAWLHFLSPLCFLAADTMWPVASGSVPLFMLLKFLPLARDVTIYSSSKGPNNSGGSNRVHQGSFTGSFVPSRDDDSPRLCRQNLLPMPPSLSTLTYVL